MAKYDYGGGCPCGLYSECIAQCEHYTPPRQEKVIKKMNEEHDFGFTFVDEESFTKVEHVVDNEMFEKLIKLRDMIMPLLLNMKKDPDKDVIKWKGSDRVKSIDAFIKKMNKLVDES